MAPLQLRHFLQDFDGSGNVLPRENELVIKYSTGKGKIKQISVTGGKNLPSQGLALSSGVIHNPVLHPRSRDC